MLIGASRYSTLPSLPSVRRSVKELAAVLTDPRVCGLPARSCTVVHDPSDGNAVGRAVGTAAAEATDMLLVYYAGHGLVGLRRNQLYLTLKDTDPERPAFHSLAYEVLREEVLNSRARNRVVILDSCFSGRAAAPLMSGNTGTILGQIDIEGAYVLTATAANESASAGKAITEFTGELIQVLRHGVPSVGQLLTLDILYGQLQARMKARNLPQPHRLKTDNSGNLALAPNPLHNALIDDIQQPGNPADSPPGSDFDTPVPAAVLVNLARRSQHLVDRLIGDLDRLERDEEDPARLSKLFEIDHMASLMRRTNEAALALAGATGPSQQREPAKITDVMRAAQAEIELYMRIEFVDVDNNIEVAAHAINDVVNLLAELYDNATAFSPPNHVVTVTARRLDLGATLQIIDSGLGIESERLTEINQQLSAPPDFTRSGSRRLGLLVVSQLAAHHGITVQLSESPTHGVLATVSLPPSTIVNRRPPPTITNMPPRARGQARVPGQFSAGP
ncbi:ATP-binding protein [Micromonospora sp. NPDC049081]|uniref:caspase, EACC1-associated type n=1 Tax=Micromonospora sp. NPDC049081 TaxID=3155150 RepID=UPI00340BCE5A